MAQWKESVASWEHWDSGLTPGLAQWFKDLTLLQLQFGSDLWPRNSICHEAVKKKKKKKKKKVIIVNILVYTLLDFFFYAHSKNTHTCTYAHKQNVTIRIR